MTLFRNILIIGTLALIIPADTETLEDIAGSVVSGTAQAVEIAATAVDDAASFCERNPEACGGGADTPTTQTVRTRPMTLTPGGTRIVDRADVNTTILVRASG